MPVAAVKGKELLSLGLFGFSVALGFVALWAKAWVVQRQQTWRLTFSYVASTNCTTVAQSLVNQTVNEIGLFRTDVRWLNAAGLETGTDTIRTPQDYRGAGSLGALLLIIAMAVTLAAIANVMSIAAGVRSRQEGQRLAMLTALAAGCMYVITIALYSAAFPDPGIGKLTSLVPDADAPNYPPFLATCDAARSGFTTFTSDQTAVRFWTSPFENNLWDAYVNVATAAQFTFFGALLLYFTYMRVLD